MEILKYKDLDYVVRYPKSVKKGEKYPVVINLHGAGSRGRDISLIKNSLFFSLSDPYLTDSISVAPQCYADSWFDLFEQLQDFIEFIISSEYSDSSRIYLVGSSMGGYTVWQLAMSRPELFAAIVPICGGGMYWNAGRLVNIGVWAFHGDSDKVVFPEESEKMVNSIKSKGGKKVKLTIYENTEHNAWTPTFSNPEVWKWLKSFKNEYTKTETEYNNPEKFG